MKKISYRLIYNRKGKLNKEGKALIQTEAYLSGHKNYFSTHIYVFPYQWDNKKRIIICHPQAELLNRMLGEFVLKLQLRELECWKKGFPISLDLLKEEHGKPCVFRDLITFGRKWVENSQRKQSTKQNLYTTLNLLLEFRRRIDFKEMDYALLQQFEGFLLKKNYCTNTIGKHMRHLRTLVNECIRQGLIPAEDSPFQFYKIKNAKSHHRYLLPQEVKILEEHVFSGKEKTLQHSLDAFLFCCYTGLRYSDFIRITSQNIVTVSSGQPWLIFTFQKTGVKVQIPLYLLFQGKAMRILKKYRYEDAFFCLKPNSSINKDLIRIGKLCGLKKHFSFHTARHTNATLLIYQGAPITTVQKLLGHRSVKTTEIYSEILPDTIIKDLKKCAAK